MTDKTYTIEATAEQVRLIRVALEFYERIVGLGQVEYLAETLRYGTVHQISFVESNDIRLACNQIKSLGWGYVPNESGSIGRAPLDARVCYDMQQAIDKATKHSDRALFQYGDEPWLNIKLKEAD